MSLQVAPLSPVQQTHPPADGLAAARDAHGHSHRHDHANARPAFRVGISVLRMSVATRLAIALLLLAPLWVAVALVAG